MQMQEQEERESAEDRHKEKMVCSILLLITLTSCVCGVFEPHNTALNYQAEESNNITVEWRFSSKANISLPSLKIHCLFVLPELKVFYHLDNSVEESQHEQFAGRVQCDKDALSTGRVRLHLSRVRTDDSGPYLCRMATEFGKKIKEFSLNITDKSHTDTIADEPKPVIPKPASRGRIGLYVGLGLAAAAAAALAVCRCTSSYTALHST
ncbi:uncharacterized protein LOC122870298 [Siniperca chuatsi]|uniref:uncharacterized protein LOC122870298 n=1 Tax=Siniperca chuatsi TaxID=119488 RepID=UPI001CE0D364|nr:uncharacterized protein LOC122870298 [Siniperca chuatsi]